MSDGKKHYGGKKSGMGIREYHDGGLHFLSRVLAEESRDMFYLLYTVFSPSPESKFDETKFKLLWLLKSIFF